MDEMDDWFNPQPPNSIDKNNLDNTADAWQDFTSKIKQLHSKARIIKPLNRKVKVITNYISTVNLPVKTTIIQPFDYKLKRKINRQKLPIDATIDLHGMSINQAERAVVDFVQTCYSQQQTCLLIITGKGSPASEITTIRNNFAEFMRNPTIASLIISYTQAGRSHGYQGAYYVILRKMP